MTEITLGRSEYRVIEESAAPVETEWDRLERAWWEQQERSRLEWAAEAEQRASRYLERAA